MNDFSHTDRKIFNIDRRPFLLNSTVVILKILRKYSSWKKQLYLLFIYHTLVWTVEMIEIIISVLIF